jgi:alpha-1,3-glucosyltransferase
VAFLISCLIKTLTVNEKLYLSTDFEVHRNWLAITQSVPFYEWYTEARSPWTLDYPPFFAYFEFLLGSVAQWVDSNIIDVNALGYRSFALIAFQRLSVILVSDLILSVGVYSVLPRNNKQVGLVLTLFSSSLFVVDHIHFQYNGMLLGLLLLAISFANSRRFYFSAAAFMILVCFKHIYLFSAPVFFVYFLRSFVRKNTRRLFLLAFVVGIVLSAAVVPIVYSGQFSAMLERLFPFGRGLVHAYWAPNAWAIYLTLDRFISKFVSISTNHEVGLGSPTTGIVGEISTLALPNITPRVCFLMTIAAYLPVLFLIWNDRKDRVDFSVWVALGNAIAFAFGWHIHEKALLMVLFPLIASALNNGRKSRRWNSLVWMFSILTCASQLPLLPRPQETALKWVLSLVGIHLDALCLKVDIDWKWVMFVFSGEIYRFFFHEVVSGGRFPFLPLMLTSTVNAMGFFWILGNLLNEVRTSLRDFIKCE